MFSFSSSDPRRAMLRQAQVDHRRKMTVLNQATNQTSSSVSNVTTRPFANVLQGQVPPQQATQVPLVQAPMPFTPPLVTPAQFELRPNYSTQTTSFPNPHPQPVTIPPVNPTRPQKLNPKRPNKFSYPRRIFGSINLEKYPYPSQYTFRLPSNLSTDQFNEDQMCIINNLWIATQSQNKGHLISTVNALAYYFLENKPRPIVPQTSLPAHSPITIRLCDHCEAMGRAFKHLNHQSQQAQDSLLEAELKLDQANNKIRELENQILLSQTSYEDEIFNLKRLIIKEPTVTGDVTASPAQTAVGKDISSPLKAVALPKSQISDTDQKMKKPDIFVPQDQPQSSLVWGTPRQFKTQEEYMQWFKTPVQAPTEEEFDQIVTTEPDFLKLMEAIETVKHLDPNAQFIKSFIGQKTPSSSPSDPASPDSHASLDSGTALHADEALDK